MTRREDLDNAHRLAAAAPPAGEPAMPDAELDPDEILIAEFQYAQAAALQANEDRARVSSYFLATAGSLVLALLGLRLEAMSQPIVLVGFACLFTALVGIGWAVVNQLASLRLAWRESCLAMNQVKAHYLAVRPELAGAFRWTDDSLPPAFKPASISSQLAWLVCLIMGLAAGAAAAFALRAGQLSPFRGAFPPGPGPQALAATLVLLCAGLAALAGWRRYRARLAESS